MDYQAFSIPWTVFTHFTENNSRHGSLSSTENRHHSDVDSVCSSMSPPPSPLSPSPSLASNDDAFHFMPSAPADDSYNQPSAPQVLPYDLCHQVPALLGLTEAQRKRSTTSNNGFYKRLLEWLNRKKKTHRRYSETWSPEQPDVRMSARKSAPMIFDCKTMTAMTTAATRAGNETKLLNLKMTGSSCGSSRTSPTASIRSDASGSSSWAGRGRSHAVGHQEYPSVKIEAVAATTEHRELHPEHLLVPKEAELMLPATPTSCYSVQSGILQFEKQGSEDDERGEIDAEWIIPWSDIEVGQLISQRGSCTINRGKWHGDVIIHRFEFRNVDEVNSFWTDVRSLSKLRHENLLLFMGIATDSPTYTIINSAPRGVSVANFRLSVKNGKQERIGMRAAVSISRQVAQATGYLHARGIVHGKLNPHNIFLDGDNYRVKLSLLDHGTSATTNIPLNYACLPKMRIGYYSPELVRSMIVQPPEVLCSVPSSKFSDVYALGSFMYDLISGRAPFHQEEIDSVLYRIGRGQTVDLSDLTCNSRLKTLISSCWSTDPTRRPTCVEVVRSLSPASLLCRSHSCSEPERLNRLGTCKLAC